MLICESPPYINLPVRRGEEHFTPNISKIMNVKTLKDDRK